MKMKFLAVLGWLFLEVLPLHGQGHIVPNGVVYSGLNFLGAYEIDVMHDPTNLFYTGYIFTPKGMTHPTTYIITFNFAAIVYVSVRVFLVSSNDSISLQPILAHAYTELVTQNYVFNSGSPFYVGLFTGNQPFAPPDRIYSDPLFGWAKLVNNQGVIQLLDSALEYQGGGIYAGRQNIIPVPEPGGCALSGLGVLMLGIFRRHFRTA